MNIGPMQMSNNSLSNLHSSSDLKNYSNQNSPMPYGSNASAFQARELNGRKSYDYRNNINLGSKDGHRPKVM